MVPAIRVENLGKKYRVAQGGPRAGYRTLRETLTATATAPFRGLGRRFTGTALVDDFWALKDVSFDVQHGEVVGVIGRNGAGKSTLLKILSRITKPTTGRALLRGRVGSLLEVGTGFHPELTGRENIFLNGSILGMSKKEIDRQFDEIVAFAGVERFLDTPVKRYSSGMYVRLAFAVAAHLDPELLIVDEVLAVGDAEFQAKCMRQMKQVSASGRTILFVSHNMAAVENLCTTCIHMSAGSMVGNGPTHQVIAGYQRQCRSTGSAAVDLTAHPNRRGSGPKKLRRLTLTSKGKLTAAVKMGDPLEIAIEYSCRAKPERLKVGLTIEDSRGRRVVSFSPTYQCPLLLKDAPASATAVCSVPHLNFVEGFYAINVYCEDAQGTESVEGACELEVTPADVFGTGKIPDPQIGAVFIPADWTIATA